MTMIRYELEEGIAHIRMDDGKVNAMSPTFFDDLDEVLDRAEKEGARALVFSGREGFFSAGLDVKLVPSLSPADLQVMVRGFARTMARIHLLTIPTVAACAGHVIAGGAVLAFACDARVALDGPFKIQMNEIAIGISLPTWVLAIGRTAVPERWHTECLLWAKAYSPLEAVEKGLFDRLADSPSGVLASALAAARDLAKLDSEAYGLTKRRMREPEMTRALALLEEERFLQAPTFGR
jgi:enoyl-CoA hydratase